MNAIHIYARRLHGNFSDTLAQRLRRAVREFRDRWIQRRLRVLDRARARRRCRHHSELAALSVGGLRFDRRVDDVFDRRDEADW